MSNIDKLGLRLTAEKAKDNFMPNFIVPTRDVLALLDELESAEKRIAELESERDKQGRRACELFDEVAFQRQQIAELVAAGIITKVGGGVGI